MTTAAPDLHAFAHHWQDEADAAFLYRALAGVEPDARKRDVYSRLAAVEVPRASKTLVAHAIWDEVVRRFAL